MTMVEAAKETTVEEEMQPLLRAKVIVQDY